MNVYIPLGIIISLLCYLQKGNSKNEERVFSISLIVVCFLMAIRYEFGPDYFNYRAIYYGILGEDVDDYTGKGQSVEVLFLRFLQLFPSFTSFVVFLTVFWFGANLYYIKTYIDSRYYWMVVLYMFFNANYILGSLVAMRTTLCACLFLVALTFLLRGKRIPYFAIIVLSSLIHSSSIALALFAVFSFKSNSVFFKSWFAFGFGIIAIISFVLGENIINYFTRFMVDNIDSLEHYSSYNFGGASQSINSLLFRIMSFFILLYLVLSGSRETNEKYIIMYKVGIVASIMLLVFGQNMISDRFFLLLNPIFIIALVRSFEKNDNRTNSMIFIFLMIISIYIFYSKMSQNYSRSFLHYQTIFGAPVIP